MDDDEKDANESELGIASKSEKLGIASKLENSPFWIWNKRHRVNQAESDSFPSQKVELLDIDMTAMKNRRSVSSENVTVLVVITPRI